MITAAKHTAANLKACHSSNRKVFSGIHFPGSIDPYTKHDKGEESQFEIEKYSFSLSKKRAETIFDHLPGIVFDLQSSCRLYADGSGCRHINREQRVFNSVTIKNSEDQTVDGSKGDDPALKPGDKVTLTYEWALKNDEEAGTEKSFTVEVPKSFEFAQDAKGDVKSADQQIIGSYEVKADSNILTVTLNSTAEAKGPSLWKQSLPLP